MIDHPEGIILTVGAKELIEKGYRNWLTNFMDAMNGGDEWTYWYKMGNQPTQTKSILYVYLCIGNRIRWRANFIETLGPRTMNFSDGRSMFGKAWIVIAGPAVRAPYRIERKGFQGFRYTHKLF